jgi:hypothetical protein
MSFWVLKILKMNIKAGKVVKGTVARDVCLTNYCNCIDDFFIKTVIILILVEIWLLLA